MQVKVLCGNRSAEVKVLTAEEGKGGQPEANTEGRQHATRVALGLSRGRQFGHDEMYF